MARLLVTGAAGLLGSALCARAPAAGHEPLGLVHERAAPAGVPARHVDVRDPEAVARAVAELVPEVVVHCAYRQADAATTREGALHVAAAARAAGARLVHLSTDVVFAGRREAPYGEADPPDPISAYGRAKADAEAGVLARDPDALVVRTSLLYAASGPVRDPQTRGALDPAARWFSDELRRPVEVGDLADALLALAPPGGPVGVLHLVGEELLDRLAFARLLAAAAGADPAALRGGPGPPDRPKRLDLARDRAQALGVRLAGPRERLDAQRQLVTDE